MSLHSSTFAYLNPTDVQLATIEKCRKAAKVYADTIDGLLPDGPDKSYIMRQVRTMAMWANICVTRHADGSPRGEE